MFMNLGVDSQRTHRPDKTTSEKNHVEPAPFGPTTTTKGVFFSNNDGTEPLMCLSRSAIEKQLW